MSTTIPVAASSGEPLRDEAAAPIRTWKASSFRLLGKRLAGLDGVRGIAVLAVAIFHAARIHAHSSLISNAWFGIVFSAWAGVDLFFVLSGFLITGILLDSRTQPGYFKNFYARRTLRIFPLYYAVVLTATVIVPLFVGVHRLPELYRRLVENRLWLILYLQNYLQVLGPHQLPGFGHFWSLAIEEQFYWFWPLIARFTPRRILLSVCVAVCALSPLLRAYLLAHGSAAWAVRQYTFTRMDSLLFGAMAAILIRETNLPRMAGWLKWIGVGVAAAALAGIAWSKGYIPYEEANETVIYGYTGLSILFAVLVYTVASGDGLLSRFCGSKVLRWFGKYSYAIYIFHAPITLAYEHSVGMKLKFHSEYLTALAEFACTVAAASAIAVVSWYVLENPVLKLRRLFEYKAA
jgi:peptidoglycan/LPS O-acetylase OafA/YrhL